MRPLFALLFVGGAWQYGPSPCACVYSSCVCSSNAELYYDRGNHHEFVHQVAIVATPGTIQGSQEYEFDFNQSKPYETYNGVNVRCRYFVRATISRNYSSNITHEQDFWVQNIQKVRRAL